MIKKIGANSYGVVEYAISTEEEVTQLPHLVGQGSTCIVVATGNVYMFNEENSSWHSLDRKSTRLNSSHNNQSRMPSSA